MSFLRDLDGRSWIGIGTFTLTLLVLGLIAGVPDLRADEFFKTIATLIVGAYIKDVVGWAFSATQIGGELAKGNAEIVKQAAQTTADGAAQNIVNEERAHYTGNQPS